MLDGRLYVMGGAAEPEFSETSSVHRYDPSTDVWEVVAPMSTARRWAAAVVVDGLLYVMSGSSLEDRGDLGTLVERYDPAADVWEAVARTPHTVGVVPDMQYALLAI